MPQPLMWDRTPKSRRHPYKEWADWKLRGGETELPPIRIPSISTTRYEQVTSAPVFSRKIDEGNRQLLMFYPYRREIVPVPVFRDMRHICRDHNPAQMFLMSSIWSSVTANFEASYTEIADVDFTTARSASDGTLPFAKKRNVVLTNSEKFAYHPHDDTFHQVGESAPMQKSGVPAKRSVYTFSTAPANAYVIYDAMTKRVQMVADAYTAHYDLDNKFGGSSRYAIATKRDFIAMLIRIKENHGKILSRLSNGETLFIGTKDEALRFINYTANGERRAAPTAFLRTLKVEDFK